MNDIDALTLKLLTSKKKYNTYLEKVEPDTASKIREYCDAIHANKDRIRALFDKYMEDPEIQITNELDDSVESCLKELLRHLETRDREKKSARNDYDEKDESDKEDECDFSNTNFEIAEEMFIGRDESFLDEPKKEKQSFFEKNEAKEKTSFWGKGVNRASGTLDSFVKKS